MFKLIYWVFYIVILWLALAWFGSTFPSRHVHSLLSYLDEIWDWLNMSVRSTYQVKLYYDFIMSSFPECLFIAFITYECITLCFMLISLVLIFRRFLWSVTVFTLFFVVGNIFMDLWRLFSVCLLVISWLWLL